MEKISLAGCVILDQSGKVLLMHRHTPKRTQWEVPGGKIDENEDTKQTAIRELKEELDITVQIVKEIGQKDFSEDGHEMHYHWFLATIVDGNITIMEPDKYDGTRYFSWQEMLSIKEELSPNTKNLVAAYFAKEVQL